MSKKKIMDRGTYIEPVGLLQEIDTDGRVWYTVTLSDDRIVTGLDFMGIMQSYIYWCWTMRELKTNNENKEN